MIRPGPGPNRGPPGGPPPGHPAYRGPQGGGNNHPK